MEIWKSFQWLNLKHSSVHLMNMHVSPQGERPCHFTSFRFIRSNLSRPTRVCLRVSVRVCFCVCLFVCLCVCLSVSLSVYVCGACVKTLSIANAVQTRMWSDDLPWSLILCHLDRMTAKTLPSHKNQNTRQWTMHHETGSFFCIYSHEHSILCWSYIV